MYTVCIATHIRMYAYVCTQFMYLFSQALYSYVSEGTIQLASILKYKHQGSCSTYYT